MGMRSHELAMLRVFYRYLLKIYRSDWSAIALAVLLGTIGIANHSMWRDEMNVWIIARDSPSLGALLENIRYDRGHPGLWHLLVALLHRFFDNPIAMQYLHGIIAIAAIALIWRYSPFNRLQKWLLSFGYLIFYEHLLIARSYGLSMLLIFAICTVWPSRKRRYWPLAGLLVLLANTNLYAFLVAIALALTLALEFFLDCKEKNWPDFIVSSLGAIAGYAIAAYYIVLPSDVPRSAFGDTFLQFDFTRLLETLGRYFAAYVIIIPENDRLLDLAVCAAIAIATFVVISLGLARQIYALFFYLFSNVVILGFIYTKHASSLHRHFGVLYFVLIAAVWLSRHYSRSSAFSRESAPSQVSTWASWQKPILSTIFCAHLLGGIYGYVRISLTPYSASRTAANYIKENDLENAFIVGSSDSKMTALSGYLRRKIYQPERQQLWGYMLPFKGDRQLVTQEEVLRQVDDLLADRPEILLILSGRLSTANPKVDLTPIASFTESLHGSEDFHLYWARRATKTQVSAF